MRPTVASETSTWPISRWRTASEAAVRARSVRLELLASEAQLFAEDLVKGMDRTRSFVNRVDANNADHDQQHGHQAQQGDQPSLHRNLFSMSSSRLQNSEIRRSRGGKTRSQLCRLIIVC